MRGWSGPRGGYISRTVGRADAQETRGARNGRPGRAWPENEASAIPGHDFPIYPARPNLKGAIIGAGPDGFV